MPERIRHYSKHLSARYATTPGQRFYSLIVAPLIFVLIFYVVMRLLSTGKLVGVPPFTYQYIAGAIGATFLRLLVAYALALAFSLPIAVLIYKSAFAERVLLPLIDVIQSVPVLAFFPIIILFFLHFNFFNGAAIFILFLSMIWNIVFSVVGGLRVIPNDIKAAAWVFRVRGFSFIRRVLLPAVVPHIIIGSLLAWAQGWNIVIVAEVLHTYIPGGRASQDLYGIGSVLVNAAAAGQNNLFILAILFMTAVIAFLNFFIWQKLLHYAERYRFE